MARYGAWNSSSCDVERGFSTSALLRGGKSEDVNTALEEALMILKHDLPPDNVAQRMLARASDLWAQHYGRPRRPPRSPRYHKGLPQRKHDTGEAAFVRMRNNATSSLLGGAGKLLPRRSDLTNPEEYFLDSQFKELTFNRAKMAENKIRSSLDGFLEALWGTYLH